MPKYITNQDELDTEVARLESGELNPQRIAVKNLCHITAYSDLDMRGAITVLTRMLQHDDVYIQQLAANAIGIAAEHNVSIQEETVRKLEKIVYSAPINLGHAQRALERCQTNMHRLAEKELPAESGGTLSRVYTKVTGIVPHSIQALGALGKAARRARV